MNKSSRLLLENHAIKSGIPAESLEDESLFLINTNYITHFDKAIEDISCKNKLIEYFSLKNRWRTPLELVSEKYPDSGFTTVSKEEMINIPDFKYRYDLGYYHFSNDSRLCLELSESFTLCKDAYIDRDFFYYFFSYRLSKRALERVRDFLAFALKVHFNDDIDEFLYNIKTVVIPKYNDTIGKERLDILNILFDSENEPRKKQLGKGTNNKFTVKQIALEYYFKIMSGTYPDDLITDKSKKLKAIAEERGLSHKNFQVAFTNVSKPGVEGKEFRSKILNDAHNLDSLKILLENDPASLRELTIEISNLRSPLT